MLSFEPVPGAGFRQALAIAHIMRDARERLETALRQEVLGRKGGGD